MVQMFLSNAVVVIIGAGLAVFLSFAPLAAGIISFHYSRSMRQSARYGLSFLCFFLASLFVFSIN